MASNNPNTLNAKCSACLNENSQSTYTLMDPTNRQPPPDTEPVCQPSTSSAQATTSKCSTSTKETKARSSINKLSLTAIGLNLRRARSFNFKTKQRSTKQATSSSGGFSALSLSPKWPLRFSCTTRKERDKQQPQPQIEQPQQQPPPPPPPVSVSEGCCRCVCYRPLGNSCGNNNEAAKQPTSIAAVAVGTTAPITSSIVIDAGVVTSAASCSSTSPSNQNATSLPCVPDKADDGTELCDRRLLSARGSTINDNHNPPLEQCQPPPSPPQISSYSHSVCNAAAAATVAASGSSSSPSVVQLVSNAIIILEEERERNRTMAAMAMAAMNGVGVGAGIGGIYGSSSCHTGTTGGDVWEPLFHIPCSINQQQQQQQQQQQHPLPNHEDCEESARRQRAREIEQGVDPPPNYNNNNINNNNNNNRSSGNLGTGTGGTRRVQLLCSGGDPTPTRGGGGTLQNPENNSNSGGCSTMTRRLQIVCPSDLPVDSLRALFQDHVTLRTCPLDSTWTGCHTQVDFVHCLVPDLLSISRCTFYWGKMDRYEAERLLDGKPEGTFLLRDSAQEEFLFSVSFRKYGRSLHARIEQWNHKFSFDSHDPGVYTSDTVCGLIEHYKDPSSCMFFEPVLTWPLHRNFTFSLQHLARAAITSRLQYDDVNQLQLPKALKGYLKEYHYRQKVRVERFDDDCAPGDGDTGGNGSGGTNGSWLLNAANCRWV